MNRYFSELLGTFALVFAGTGAIIVNDVTGGTVTHPGVALTFGLVVTAMIYAIGGISGAHLNPAVTAGFWFAGRMPGRDVVPYIASQGAGALIASLFWKAVFPTHATLGATLPSVGLPAAFALEVALSFLLMCVIIHVATGAKEQGVMAGVAVGATVGLETLFAGPLTGASMNPARSLGPAIVSGHLTELWLYLSAPLVGAVIAILCCRVLRAGECCTPPASQRPTVS